MSHQAVPGSVLREDPQLSERQRDVFVALVSMHGRTARAVGSEALTAASAVRGSAASVRQVLADLEAMGLLARAHPSSGRIPSGAGYAYFVRNELMPSALPDEALWLMDERLNGAAHDVEQLLHEASRLISTLALQLGLAVAATLEDERLSDLELAPLEPARSLLVLSLGGGGAHTLHLELESPLEPGTVAEVGEVLRDRLVGLTLAEARERLATDPELVRDSVVRIVVRAAAASWTAPSTRMLYSAGARWIAAQPEFAQGGQLGSLLQIVESGPPLDRLMVGGIEGHAAVRIALDEDVALSGCSLVSIPLPGTRSVAVGVLGPLRMDYARALAVVDAVGARIARYL